MANRAYFLTGCTATGKSAVAHWLARRWDCDILSADSMLVYRGMDIGTAKPTPAERAEVAYAGVDLVGPGEICNIEVFCRAARAALASAAARGRRLIVVGGTGLYLNCLLCGLERRPPPDPALRAELEAVLARDGVAALAQRLREVAPEKFAGLTGSDRLNPRRLMRALELAAAGAAAGAPARLPPPIPGLRLSAAQLHASIAARAQGMFDGGLLEETRVLLAQGLAGAPTAGQAIGYAEAAACLRGELMPAAAVARVAARTRRLAKKQLTWFRHKMRVDWLDIDLDMPLEQRAMQVLAYWDRHGPVTMC